MTRRVPVRLEPLGVTLELERGAGLKDALFPFGVEFPCGGTGACRGCRVRLVEGELPVTDSDESAFTSAELAAGWRLACLAEAAGPLTLEVAQWETPVLSDDTPFEFEPGTGAAIAVDIGTTTVVAQLLDRRTGDVHGVRTALNPQCVHGADLMSRVGFAVQGGAARLAALIHESVGRMVAELAVEGVDEVLLCGNTAMHHFFCGIDAAPLAAVPFEPRQLDAVELRPADLSWALPAHCRATFLPCLGGFVGSDILAGIVATGLARAAEPGALVDLGTNGEIVCGDRGGLVCASTAAGPAFEAGRIRMGMRAAEGAISHVRWEGGKLRCQVIGGEPPRGICGSGLVAAVAAALEAGLVLPNGRLAGGARELTLAPPVGLVQADIRELQLAKAAIAAGLRLLSGQLGLALDELHAVHLAGAFGNYVDRAAASRIGLLEAPAARVKPAGNTALRGVKMLLLSPARRAATLDALRAAVCHVPLGADTRFQEAYVAAMPFPEA